MTTDAVQSPLPDSHLVELGRVTANFALLDWILRLILAVLSGRNLDLGMIVSADLSFPALLDCLVSSYQVRFPEPGRIQPFVSLLRRARRVGERRNQMVHSHWGIAADDSMAVRMKESSKRGGQLTHQSERLSSEELNRFAMEIATLTHDVPAEFFTLMKGADA